MTEAIARRGEATRRRFNGAQRPVARPRLEWLLVSVGTANLLVLLVQAHSFVQSVYLNADNASAFVLPALAGHAPPGAVVNLGDHPWYEAWLFMRATAGFPHYRLLWEAAPFIAGLLGIAAVAVCAYWGAGRLAGLICATVLLAAGADLRGILFTPETRVLLVLHAGVLCGSLMFVHDRLRASRLTRGALFGLSVPLVIFTGAGLTDKLLISGGMLPFVLAPLLCWLRLGSAWRRTSLFAIVTSAASLLIALLLTHIMHANGVFHAPLRIEYVQSGALVGNLQSLISGLASLGGGDFFGEQVTGGSLPTFLLGMLIIAALVGILRSIWRWGTAHEHPLMLSSRPTRAAERRDLFIAYWVLTFGFVLAAVALTTVSGNDPDGRYLLGAWIAGAALLGALATGRRARIGLTLAVCIFGALTLYANLVSGVPKYGIGPEQRTAGEIEHFVRARGASIGYAGYWDAAPVTWETNFQTKVYPISPCATPSGFCPFAKVRISSWYKPTPQAATFLLTDSQANYPAAITSPPAAFGHPFGAARFGTFTVYIYHHNIAAHL